MTGGPNKLGRPRGTMRSMVALTALLAVSAAASPIIRPTATDIKVARDRHASFRAYPEDGAAGWETDLQASLARGTPDEAAATLATRYKIDPAVMRRLVELWIIAHDRAAAGLSEADPGLCAQTAHGGATGLDEKFTLGDQADTRALEREALAAAVPGFAVIRAALRRDAPLVHPDSGPRRATVVAETPPFAERPIAAADHTPASVAGAAGLAPLPPGFQLVRAERQGARAVAISVSQALDTKGEPNSPHAKPRRLDRVQPGT